MAYEKDEFVIASAKYHWEQTAKAKSFAGNLGTECYIPFNEPIKPGGG